MKAAVIYANEAVPRYVDFPEPVAQNDQEIVVRVKAVALKHFDKQRATGNHYSASTPSDEGRIPGGDGVCLLENGTRVYGMGIHGMLAEKAVIDKNRIVAIPDEVDDATAAALPNAVIGAAMALRFKAHLQPGQAVLINGATGFTGQVAVQIAKHYGAGKIVVTGRNEQALQHLLTLGADEAISLTGDELAIQAQLQAIHAQTPFDSVIDYLWGRSAELILESLKGKGAFTHPLRFVSVGSMMSDTVQLSSAILRSLNIQLTGSGLGSWTMQEVQLFFSEILPEMFQLAAAGKLSVQTSSVRLDHIADLWQMGIAGGSRIVVTI